MQRTIPVPLEELLELARVRGIDVLHYPDELTGAIPGGKCVNTGDAYVIFLSRGIERDPARARQVIAHEICHALWGLPGASPRDEVTADHLAQDMLMPDWWLEDKRWMPIWMLAEEAGVGRDWAEERVRRYAFKHIEN